jgi:DNA (cytosine-5)-methyltransferase 1
MADRKPIPVIDLFAGPGGLGEGFSSLTNADGTPAFNLRVSIEKDFHAHQTLSLRALFRHFSKGKAPDCYYDYKLFYELKKEMLKFIVIPVF